MKSPVIASCVADGCFTVKAYRDMVEKEVMVGGGGRGPRYYGRVGGEVNFRYRI